jgi:hypothetical protein
MPHKTLTVLGFTAFVIALFAGVQQRRAAKKLPEVLAIANGIPVPSDAVLVKDAGISVNEYSAATWRYYSSARSMEEVREMILTHAQRTGFTELVEQATLEGTLYFTQNGEFEIRLLAFDSPQDGANFALSANWYGADR